jgi:RHS repeat-associated protein
LAMAYDVNRNVRSRTEGVTNRVETYGYDPLNRLLEWEVTGDGTPTSTTNYAYDEVGNLTGETVEGAPERDVTYAYGQNGAPKHAVTSRNGAGYGYDAAGRQTSAPERTVAYNRFNLPSTVRWGDGDPQRTTEFAYDADGVRVRKSDAEQTMTYVAGLFERRSDSGTGGREIHNLHNIVADGRTVAQVNLVQAAGGGPVVATKPWYLHTDHQGTTTVVSNAAGRRIGGSEDFLNELFYDPFGRRVDNAGEPLGRQRRGGVRLGFQAMEHEDETGMINMLGRIYDSETSRFPSPDPHVTDPLNSQSLNRYSYVWNNPVNLTDPTGYDPEGDIVLEDDTGYSPFSSYVFGGNRGMGVAVAFGGAVLQAAAGDSDELKAWLGLLPGQQQGGEVILVRGQQSLPSTAEMGALGSTPFVAAILGPKAVDSWRNLENSLNVAPTTGADYDPGSAGRGLLQRMRAGFVKDTDGWVKKKLKGLVFSWLTSRNNFAVIEDIDGKRARVPKAVAIEKMVTDGIPTPDEDFGPRGPGPKGKGKGVRGMRGFGFFLGVIAAGSAFETGCATNGQTIGTVDAAMTVLGAPVTLTEMGQQMQMGPAYESATNLAKAGIGPSSATWGPAMAHTIGRW